MSFHPIAAATVRTADHLEPAFQHISQVETAQAKLADHLKRRKRKPNFLIFLMDDVGWGDLGCYGGGGSVGGPAPTFDKVARPGLQLDSCYFEPPCSPSHATLRSGRV